MDSASNELKINELEKEIASIIPSHVQADAVALKASAKVQLYQLKETVSLISTIESTNTELKCLSQKIQTATTSQEQQSNALILWTKVMAVAIVIQAITSAFQIYLSLHHTK